MTGSHDFCNCIHKGLIEKFNFAIVWGVSVKYSPMKVGKDHVLDDGDVVQIIKRIPSINKIQFVCSIRWYGRIQLYYLCR